MKLPNLPNEILDIILSYTTPPLKTISLVCKDFLNAYIYRIKIHKVILSTRNEHNSFKTWNQFKKKANITDVVSNKDSNNISILYHLIKYAQHAKLLLNENLQHTLNDTKFTNIIKLTFDTNFNNIKFQTIYIPSHITEISLIYCNISNLIFNDESRIRKVKFNMVFINEPVQLPNTIEHIHMDSTDVNFVDCTFERLKHITCIQTFKQDSYGWMGRACSMATDYVKIPDNIGHVDEITTDKEVHIIDDKYIDKLNFNLRSLNIHCFGDITPKIINYYVKFNNLRHLDIMCIGEGCDDVLQFNFEYLKSLKLDFDVGKFYDSELHDNRMMQKISIDCKNLLHVDICNCNIRKIKCNRLNYCKIRNSKIYSLNVNILKTVKLYKVKYVDE